MAPHEVERSLKHGAIWATRDTGAPQAIRFAGVIVLARLLTPSDYGAAALAVAIASYSCSLEISGTGARWIQASNVHRGAGLTPFWCALRGGGELPTLGVALGAYPFCSSAG